MAECIHFGICGGCSYQDLAYEVQLELKRSLVAEALHPFQARGEFEVCPTLASPKPYRYRHMIALSVKRRQGQLRMGFIGHDRRAFLPIDDCPISDDRINAFLPAALQKLEELPPERKFNTSQVVLRVGTDGDVVTSIRTDRGKLLQCSVMGKTFTFSMSSFFQNNFSILETFIETIKQFLEPDSLSLRGSIPSDAEAISDQGLRPSQNDVKKGTLFDLYSGVGLISILSADRYQTVIGIEEGYEAVKYAKENATKNKVENIAFWEGKVENLLSELTKQSPKPLHVVVDPPRIGLKSEVISCLNDLPIERLVYVSCHLEALKRDLGLLTERFRIVEVQPIDFFPQTKHIETIVLLKPLL